MIEYLDFHAIDVIAVKVSGKITSEEFDFLKKEISDKIDQYEKVNWYYEMQDFEGWDLKAFFTDIIFSIKNTTKFNRIAFVGENSLEKIMAQVSKLFTPAEIKYFDINNRQSAIDWIKYGVESK
jgi:hypothetical protein